jgi:hypothetical protein
MVRRNLSLVLGLGLVLLMIQTSTADLVVGYDAQDTTLGLTAIDGTGVTGSTLTRGSGLDYEPSGSGQDFNASKWTNDPMPDPTHHWDFSFTSSIPYDLSSLQLRASSSNVGPMTLQLQIDSGSGFAQQGTNQSVLTTATDVVFNFNLLAVTSATVRIFGFAASNSGDNSQLAILDSGNYIGTADVVLNGTVAAVPEPSAFLCGGLLCAVVGSAVAGKKVAWRRTR